MKYHFIHNSLVALTFIALMTGCGKPSDISENKLRDFVQSKAQEVLGEKQYAVVWIPSRGTMWDGVFIVQSKMGGPSLMAKKVGKLLPDAKNKNLALIIAGSNSAKSTQVIRDAIDLNADVNLTGMNLVFAGKKKYQRVVKKKSESKGLEFHFIELKN